MLRNNIRQEHLQTHLNNEKEFALANSNYNH